MISRDHDLAVGRQAKLLGLSRASVYYTPQPVAETDLALMCRLDRLHLELPFAGSRMLRDLLRAEGVTIRRARAYADAAAGNHGPLPTARHDDATSWSSSLLVPPPGPRAVDRHWARNHHRLAFGQTGYSSIFRATSSFQRVSG